MSLKHLGAGSQMPPLVKGKLRIYSMVFCPYAQRVRLVLAAKNIPYETVNVRLDKKPEWYLSINPPGQVPFLQHDDGRSLPESLIVAEYLDNIYPENKLIPSDPFTNASHKLLIENFNKVIGFFYKLLRGSEPDADKGMLEALDVFEKKIQSNFFGGDKPAFADYMIWPWIERLEYLSYNKKLTLDANRFPKFLAYVERMKQQPAVKETIISAETYDKFFKPYLSGEEPDYDVGLRK